MATCKNHPIKMATVRCKCCNTPLCNECKRVTDIGIFCSEECEEKTRTFQERAAGYTVSYKNSLFTAKTMKGILVLAILVLAFGALMYIQYDVRSWADLEQVVRGWLRAFLP